jgi:hypothetical protein
MIREIFEQRLASLSARQEEKITSLVEEYRKDVGDVQSTALHYSQAGGVQARQALLVIAQLGETAVESLASTVAAQKPVPDTSLLIDMVKGFVFAETAVTGRLKAALTDTRMVPQPPEMRALEGVGPPYRVCDEGYVALRRILNSESYLQYLMESRHFLSLPDAAKNLEIESWLQTSSFTRYLEDVDAEEE